MSPEQRPVSGARYKGNLRAISVGTSIGRPSIFQKNSDSQIDFDVVTEGVEFGVRQTRRSSFLGMMK